MIQGLKDPVAVKNAYKDLGVSVDELKEMAQRLDEKAKRAAVSEVRVEKSQV